MPYATVQDVKSLAPSVPINAQSQPSEGDVNTWIADAEAGLNASLRNIGYVLPIVGPQSLRILKTIVANAVMASVMRARPNPESDPEAFQKRADTLITRLSSSTDPLNLPDAETTRAPVKDDTSGRFSWEFADFDPRTSLADRPTRNKVF